MTVCICIARFLYGTLYRLTLRSTGHDKCHEVTTVLVCVSVSVALESGYPWIPYYRMYNKKQIKAIYSKMAPHT